MFQIFYQTTKAGWSDSAAPRKIQVLDQSRMFSQQLKQGTGIDIIKYSISWYCELRHTEYYHSISIFYYIDHVQSGYIDSLDIVIFSHILTIFHKWRSTVRPYDLLTRLSDVHIRHWKSQVLRVFATWDYTWVVHICHWKSQVLRIFQHDITKRITCTIS